MADAISVGNGKYLSYVNDSIQGMGGKPYAHKPGKKLICQTQYQTQQQRNNGCLCNYQAVKVYRTFCYLQSQSVEVYKQGMCPRGIDVQTYSAQDQPTQKKKAMVWKWCGWYEYVGCQGYPGGGGWTDPDIGTSLNKASKKQQTLCAPQYIGNKEYTHSVQQRLVTSYQCCTTQSGLQGCCRQVDSDSQGQKKCVTSWLIHRQSPAAQWGLWQFQKKIGCVGQNKYIIDKASVSAKIDIIDCQTARGYALTACGTCSDSLLYTMFVPDSHPDFQCKYWVLYWASYNQSQQNCGWGQWAEWPWRDTDNPPDQSIVKGVNGWAPQQTRLCRTVDGRQADTHLYQCKTKRVWYWKAFDTQQQRNSFDPASIKKADNQKCKPCTQSTFQVDHTEKKPGKRLGLGQQGAPCVEPQLPRSVIRQDKSCYDLYLYQLQLQDYNTPPQAGIKQGCIKKLSYKKDQQTQQKDYRKLAQGKTQWQLLNTTYDNVLVLDNLGKTVRRANGSWYFLRAVPCNADPQQWNSDSAAQHLPQDKQFIDACTRVFLAGVYCKSDSTSPIIQNGQVVGYNKKPYVSSGVCDKWLKLGKYTQQEITQSKTNTTTYKYDLTKKNQWQTPRWRDQGDKFDLVYIKTSTTRDIICDKYPDPPKIVYYRAKVLQLQLQCSDSKNPNWNGHANIKWPAEAFCISDSVPYCSSTTPANLAVYTDNKIKNSVQQTGDYYLVQGCKAYMCIQLTAQSTPLQNIGQCNKAYQTTTPIVEQANKIVFNNCVQYSRYSLWKATDPCACTNSNNPKCSVWSIVPKLNTNPPQQIAVCSCNQKWAIKQIKTWLAQYTEGQQSQLISKLKLNQIIPIKKQDGSFVWYYLNSFQIQKPQQWLDQHGDLMPSQQIDFRYMHNPCQFVLDQQLPQLQQPSGRYIGAILKFIPYCYLQTGTGIYNKGSVQVRSKIDQSFQKCKCGQFQHWCNPQGVPQTGYYLDAQLTQKCTTRVQGEHLVLLPPSDATQVYYYQQERRQPVVQGYSYGTQCTDCDTNLGNSQIWNNMDIRWGGSDYQQFQQNMSCCPRYKFIYTYVIQPQAMPGAAPSTGPYVQIGVKTQSTGYMSYQPVSQQGRSWKAYASSRTVVYGQPVCDAVTATPSWTTTSCTGRDVQTAQFSVQFVLANTPSINTQAANSLPWQIFRNLGTPDISNFRVHMQGYQSYIVGQGIDFQWDVQGIKLFCTRGTQPASNWDNTNCAAGGHTFNLYTTMFTYAQWTSGGSTVKHISPRSLQWSPAITHPQIPKANWIMTRRYTVDFSSYQDTWGELNDFQLTCGADKCQWSGQSCGTTYRLIYTRQLTATDAPVDHPQACWNVNPPQITGCTTWKYTRKYIPVQCLDTDTYVLGWQNSQNQQQNWQTAEKPSGTPYRQWFSNSCKQAYVYIQGSSTKPSVSPQALGIPVPSSIPPKYLYKKVQKTWSYTASGGLKASRTKVTLDVACNSSGAASSCGANSSYAQAYTEFQRNNACTAPAVPQVPQPWAQYYRLWTFYAGQISGGRCYTQNSIYYNTLVCQQKTNPTECVTPSSQTRYAYTRGARDLDQLGRAIGSPTTRYWTYKFTYTGYDSNGNRQGTWRRTAGPVCSVTQEQGWDTLQCRANYRQVYTQHQTTCIAPVGLPHPPNERWPADVSYIHVFTYTGRDSNGNRKGTWSDPVATCSCPQTGWDTKQCKQGYGQKYTICNNDSKKQTAVPVFDNDNEWPADANGYIFKYRYVVRLSIESCGSQTSAKIQFSQDTTKTGYMSYQSGSWQSYNSSRTVIKGQPTCQAQSTGCQWTRPSCSGSTTQLVFQTQLILSTQTISSSSKPWDLITTQCSAPSLSGYYIKVTGHQSYIIGTGVVFSWDVSNAVIVCNRGQSGWDNINCVKGGHQFTYFSSSSFTYGICSGNSITHRSPRLMFPTMQHPAIPKASWMMTRTYNSDRTSYTDTWGAASSAQLYCGQDLCSWSGQQCGSTWKLTYTQPLGVGQAPADSPDACWNKNAPSFQTCFTYVYTRKYAVSYTTTSNGVTFCISYNYKGAQQNNWQIAANNQSTQGWDSMQCAMQHTYTVHRMLTDQQRSKTPQQLFNVSSPPWPSYVKITATGAWFYSSTSGVTGPSIGGFTSVVLSCTQQQATASCTNGNALTAQAYFLAASCPSNTTVTKDTFLIAIQSVLNSPWAKLVSTWSTQNGWSGWSFDSLVCQKGVDTDISALVCQQLKDTITIYYYTRGGLSAAPTTQNIPTPNKVYKYTANTTGTINSATGQYCFSNTPVQGQFIGLRCVDDPQVQVSGCAVIRQVAFAATVQDISNVQVIRQVAAAVVYSGRYCKTSCNDGTWNNQSYTLYCRGQTVPTVEEWSSFSSCCGTYKTRLNNTSSTFLSSSGCIASLRPSTISSNIASYKKYWYGPFKLSSETAQHMLAETQQHPSSSVSLTLQKYSASSLGEYDYYCQQDTNKPAIGKCKNNCGICAAVHYIYYNVTDCAYNDATVPDSVHATFSREKVKYKQIVYQNGCQKSSTTGTYSGTLLRNSQLGTWIETTGSTDQYNSTWRYYYVCNAPTTQPGISGLSLSANGGQDYYFQYPWDNSSATVQLSLSFHFLGNSGQKLIVCPYEGDLSAGYGISCYGDDARRSCYHNPDWGATRVSFTIKFLDSNNRVLYTKSGSITSALGQDHIYTWTPQQYSISGGTCGRVAKVQLTISPKTNNWQCSYTGTQCNQHIGLYIYVQPNTRSITNLSAYANAQASLQR